MSFDSELLEFEDEVDTELLSSADDIRAGIRAIPAPKTYYVVEAHFRDWITDAETDTRRRFEALRAEIHRKYLFSSNLQELLYSVEYMSIVGLGPRVVPLLLTDIERGATMWFWALRALTQHDAGNQLHPSDFRGVAQAWLQWGQERGLI